MLIILFSLVTLAQLVGCFTQNRKLMRLTKPFLVPLLLIMYFTTWNNPAFSWIVVFGLFFGFIGDLFLMYEKNQLLLTFGIAGFGLGHILYSIEIARHISSPSVLLSAIILLVYAIIGFAAYHSLSKYIEKAMKIPVVFYVIVIMSMSIFAATLLSTGYSLPRLITFIGSLCFIFSDLILGFQLFKGPTRYSYFIVMLFYISAQAMLTYGFMQRI